MSTIVNIDGAVVPPDEAKVSVFDRGFLYGDSVYETVRTYARRPFLMDQHLDRLRRSAAGIGLDLPGGLVGIGQEIVRTIGAADGTAEINLRVMVSRGARVGWVDLDTQTAERPTLVIIARPFGGFDATAYDDGVLVSLVSVRRTGTESLDPSIKSGNYLNNIMALREARAKNAFECLMLNRDGYLTEASTSNVFLVRDRVVLTPALHCGLLDGITRSFVLRVARDAGYEVCESELTVDDLAAADEAFLTSSLKEVMPIRAVDASAVGEGRPGPVTLDLLSRYRAAARREVGL